MVEWLSQEQWSPYVVGIGIGILCWLVFLISDTYIGCSTAFTRTSGMLEKIFNSKRVNKMEYYKIYPPVVDWGWMLVLGIFIGSLLSANLSNSFNIRWIPAVWYESFNGNVLMRMAVAFIGGIVMGFGSRYSGGCTSGHGISGCLQLLVSSWVTFIFIFLSGIISALVIYKIFGIIF
jgi:uncharacterized membrane protein YedE/YeeE